MHQIEEKNGFAFEKSYLQFLMDSLLISHLLATKVEVRETN